MDDPRFARRAEAAAHLPHEVDHLGAIQPLLLPEDLREVFAFESFHRQVRQRGGLVAHLEHADHVWRIERRGDADLAQKPPHVVGAREHLGEQHLDRRARPVFHVHALVHLAHAAARDHRPELVRAERLIREPTEPAGLQRVLEIATRFEQERLAVGRGAHGRVALGERRHDDLARARSPVRRRGKETP